MNIVRGSIVRATAGRDKNGFFVVLDLHNEYATICNGKRRSIEKPKLKNIKHLSPTSTVVSENFLCTNREIRKTLSRFVKS